MSNPRIEALIAERLKSGMMHPGDPDNDIKPTPIALPFRTTGQPKEMADLVDGSVKLLSEAIVALIEIEGDSEIVPKSEVRTLRRTAGDAPGPQVVPLFCHCDKSTPLMMLSVTDPAMIITDGRAMIGAMHKRESACPHKVRVVGEEQQQ